MGQFDPLSSADPVPSWPDDAGYTPGGPPQLALSTETGATGAWPTELGGLPPIGPSVTEPKLSLRILMPAAAALLIAVGFLVPWTERGDGFFSVASVFADRGVRDFGDFYLLCFAGPMALIALLAGFAAGTDLKPVKLVQLGIAVVALGIAALYGLTASPSFVPLAIGFALVNLLWAIAIGISKRLVLRVTAASYLVVCVLLHAGTLATWDAPWLSGMAYLPVLGYLVGAVGAAIGPRYEQAYRSL
ncbi:MAG: hypothetical protein ACRDT4_15350 [Micromonosporaceae bacterium]